MTTWMNIGRMFAKLSGVFMEELINKLEELRIEIRDIYPDGFKPTEDDKYTYSKMNDMLDECIEVVKNYYS